MRWDKMESDVLVDAVHSVRRLAAMGHWRVRRARRGGRAPECRCSLQPLHVDGLRHETIAIASCGDWSRKRLPQVCKCSATDVPICRTCWRYGGLCNSCTTSFPAQVAWWSRKCARPNTKQWRSCGFDETWDICRAHMPVGGYCVEGIKSTLQEGMEHWNKLPHSIRPCGI